MWLYLLVNVGEGGDAVDNITILIYMKRLLTVLAAGMLTTSSLLAQEVKAQVLDYTTGRAIGQATVSVWGPVRMRVQTDKAGLYRLGDLPAGEYTLTITAPGYEAKQIKLTKQEGKDLILPMLKLDALKEQGPDIDAFALVEDLDDGASSGIEQSALLTASRDPFVSAASYAFSAARFARRGYDSPYTQYLVNGVPMNDLNNGYSPWSLWGGLNDFTRNQTSSETGEPIATAFGSLGASTDLQLRPSQYRAQRRLSYSNSNRTYSNRLMATWQSGLMPSGWAWAVGVSRRSGNGLYSYVRGMHYDAWSYFLGIEKKIDENNSLSLVGWAAPTRRGVASASTQEAYDLVGSNYYNPNVGMQSGKWRNARERNNHEPVIQLSHYFDNLARRLKITTSLSYRFGWNSYSALNWYNAPDPRPDYYRYLPSYFTTMASSAHQDPASAGMYEELWRSDRNVRYIDWEALYAANRANTAPLYNASGKLIGNGARALYMIEERHTDQREFGASTHANWVANDRLRIDGGLYYRHNNTANYNRVGDLLGANYLYDVDKFAERDFGGDPSKSQIDLRNPDHIAVRGDRFGYDYQSVIQRYSGWANMNYSFSWLDVYLGASLTQTNMYRIGNQQRGLFPDNSLGESKQLRFLDLGVKAGATYKISGQHFVLANFAYIEQAPMFTSVFVSPRTRNTTVANPESERLLSAELAYAVRLPWLRGRVTGFYTRMSDKTKSMSFYDDAQAAFSNFVLSDIATRHLGVELGLEAKLTPTLSANGALALGHYSYDSNPTYIQTIDNSNRIVDSDVVYWKGLMLNGTPQTAATLGLTYRAPWYATFGVSANYFGRNYISMNPALRTDKARAAFDQSVTTPRQLNDGMTVDIFASYSWRLKRDVYLRFNLSINNLLNNKTIHSSGFEQLRIRTQRDDNGIAQLYRPFDPKIAYIYGTTFFFNTSLQF